MASFEQHLNGAVITSGILIVPLHSAGILSIDGSFMMLLLGIIGGVLPDLDSDSSKPLQIIFKIISIFAPLLLLLTFDTQLPLIGMIGIWIVSTLFLHLVLFRAFLALTTHRGIIHSVPMGVLFAQLTTAYFLYKLHYDLAFASLAGFFILYGYLTHLLLDEIVSLNALGLRVKHSFGSAFKLFDFKNWRGTIVLYLLILFFTYNIPFYKEIFIEILNVIKSIKIY